MDPRDFLLAHAPFSELSESGLTAVEDGLEIAWAEGGDRLVERGAPADWLWLLRKGSARLELDGQLIETLEPGEVFGLSAASGGEARLTAIAATDCLLYRIPASIVRRLVGGETRFAAFFVDSLAERLRALAESNAVALQGGQLEEPIGALVSRRALSIDATATVAEAARRMTEERVGSLLVQVDEARPEAIVTDRDLRTRVLVAGRQPTVAVGEIASRPLITAPAETAAAEALLLMVRAGIHHLAVEAADGTIAGVVTPSDLLRHHQRSPLALLRRIEQATSTAGLARYTDDLAEMVEMMVRRGIHAETLGRMVAGLNDALISHLLRRASDDLELPADSFAWIVFGSEGRQEQSFVTDQDNALVLVDDAPELLPRAHRLAERVVAELVEVGVPRCPGHYMATRWLMTRAEWIERVGSWAARPTPQAMLDASNILDFRIAFGGLDLEPLETAIRSAATHRLFLAYLARAALEMRPPLGLFGGVRDDQRGIDLKAAALVPIVGLARVFALEAGSRAGSTLRRLAAARRAGVISEESEELLAEAFRFAFALRVEQQIAARAAGEPTARVHLDRLGPARRRHLGEALRAIRTVQTTTEQRLSLDRLV